MHNSLLVVEHKFEDYEIASNGLAFSSPRKACIPLEDCHRTVSEYSIKKESTLHLVLRLRGGALADGRLRSKNRSKKRTTTNANVNADKENIQNNAFVPAEKSEFEDVAAEKSEFEDVAAEESEFEDAAVEESDYEDVALSRKEKTRKKKKSISSGQVEQANKKKKRKKNTAGKAIDGKNNAKPSLGNDAKPSSADKSNADDGDEVYMPIPTEFGGDRSDELVNTLYQQGYSSRLMIGDGSCFPSGLCEHFRLMGINLTSSELRKRMLDWIRIEYEKGEASAHSSFLHYPSISEDVGVLYKDEPISFDEYMAKMGGSGYFDEFEIRLVVNHLPELIGYHLSLCIVTLDQSGNLEERWVDPMIEGKSVRQQKHLYFSLHNPMSSDFCHYNNITSVPNQEKQRAIPYNVQVNEATLPTVDENVDSTSEVDGDDEAILPTVDENVDSTSEVDGDDDAMSDRIEGSHDFENLVHTLEGNSDMDTRSKKILQYFDEFVDRCRQRGVPVDDIKWFRPCVPKKLKKNKLLLKLLHYCPTTVGNFCGSDGHPASKVNRSGVFTSATWAVVCAAMTSELYKASAKANVIPYQFTYRNDYAEDIGIHYHDIVMEEYTTFLKKMFRLCDHVAFLSGCTATKAEELLGAKFLRDKIQERTLIALPNNNDKTKLAQLVAKHPEIFHNKELQNEHFGSYCDTNDAYYNLLREAIGERSTPSCTVFNELFQDVATSPIFQIILAEANLLKQDWASWNLGRFDEISISGRRTISRCGLLKPPEGFKSWGDYMVATNGGIFDPTKLPEGFKSWGDYMVATNGGIFDPTKLPEGFKSWGDYMVATNGGIFDPTKLPEGFKSWGDYMVATNGGIFDPTKLPEGFKSWGDYMVATNGGIFDPTKLPEGFKSWGDYTVATNGGIFDPTKLPEGFKSWGDYMVATNGGIFDPTKLPEGFKSWGDYMVATNGGIFDPTKLPEGYKSWAEYNMLPEESARKSSLKAFDDDNHMFLIRCNYQQDQTEAKGCEGKSYTVGHYDKRKRLQYCCLLCTEKAGLNHLRWEKIGNRCLTREEIDTVYNMKKDGVSLADVIEILELETEVTPCEMVCCNEPGSLVTLQGKKGSRYLCNDTDCRNRCEWGEQDSSGVLQRCENNCAAPGRFCGGSVGKYCAGLFKTLNRKGEKAFRIAAANSKDVKKLGKKKS